MKQTRYSLLMSTLLIAMFSTSIALASKLAWETPSGDSPTGYKILVGTTSGSYTQELDVGNVNEYEITSLYSALGLSSGTVYYLSINAYNNDGNSTSTYETNYGLGVVMGRVLTDNNGVAKLVDVDSEGNIVKTTEIAHSDDWYPLSISLASNGNGALLWDNFQGTAVIWFLDSSGNKTGSQSISYTAGTWYPRCYTLNENGTGELLWDNLDGTVVIWFLDSNGTHTSSQQYNYTTDTWFLTSYASNNQGGIFVWDNVAQTPLADTWLWVDAAFAGSDMDKYKFNHYTDSWTPLSASIMGSDDTRDQTIAWLENSTEKRVIVHWLNDGEKTGKYLDIATANNIIWYDTR